jgi:hypothetical protein
MNNVNNIEFIHDDLCISEIVYMLDMDVFFLLSFGSSCAFHLCKEYLLVFCKASVSCTSFEMHGASLEVFASMHLWSSSRTFFS